MDQDKTRTTRARGKQTRQKVSKAVTPSAEESSEGECEEKPTDNIPSPPGNNREMDAENISRSSSTSPIISADSDKTPKNRTNNGSFGCRGNSLERTLQAEEPDIPPRNLPAVNVPERIVLCIDTSEDPECMPFKLENGKTYSPLYMIKRIVEIFIYSKNTINKRHEFALVMLHDNNVSWVRNFTSDRRLLLKELEKLSPSSQGPEFDLTQLFDVLFDNMPLPESVPDPSVNAPSFVPRVIILYSRSRCLPTFTGGTFAFDAISNCPYFTLDMVYIHEEPSEENECEAIYYQLCQLDKHGYSYTFDVLRNATKLHDNMAKLLAHPLQRRRQIDNSYKFEVA